MRVLAALDTYTAFAYVSEMQQPAAVLVVVGWSCEVCGCVLQNSFAGASFYDFWREGPKPGANTGESPPLPRLCKASVLGSTHSVACEPRLLWLQICQ